LGELEGYAAELSVGDLENLSPSLSRSFFLSLSSAVDD
jgi:hypothetical protein